MKNTFAKIKKPTSIEKKLQQKDKDKSTPLHYAARYNHHEMCKLLLKNGAGKLLVEIEFLLSIIGSPP